MSETAIRIENLGKKYKLGQTVDLARNFRETLMSLPNFFGSRITGAGKDLARRLTRSQAHESQNAQAADAVNPREENGWFWALRDINLEIKKGEAVGIIGRNGAGKSTLLKVLSRITWPTTGQADIFGSVGALLEVGTGMHPELSGRENIFLNGAILGMHRDEVAAKFDEIVEFAGTEKFLDTPLKRYSSGMRVRLGFSVAAHLEPEILIVDEVLSVGDAEFRKKCLGKMDDVTQGGRTVLFVSHNLSAVEQLCSNACIVESGSLIYSGFTGKTISKYVGMNKTENVSFENRKDRKGTGEVTFSDIAYLDGDNNKVDCVAFGESLTFQVSFQSSGHAPKGTYKMGIGIVDSRDNKVTVLCNDLTEEIETGWPDSGVVFCCVPMVPFTPGTYFLNLFLSVNGRIIDYVIRASSFAITAKNNLGLKHMPPEDRSPILLPQTWRIEKQ